MSDPINCTGCKMGNLVGWHGVCPVGETLRCAKLMDRPLPPPNPIMTRAKAKEKLDEEETSRKHLDDVRKKLTSDLEEHKKAGTCDQWCIRCGRRPPVHPSQLRTREELEGGLVHFDSKTLSKYHPKD